MKTQRSLILLTLTNLALLGFLLARTAEPVGAQDRPAVLRGSALEIVDAQGRVRATEGSNRASAASRGCERCAVGATGRLAWILLH